MDFLTLVSRNRQVQHIEQNGVHASDSQPDSRETWEDPEVDYARLIPFLNLVIKQVTVCPLRSELVGSDVAGQECYPKGFPRLGGNTHNWEDVED